MGVNMTLLALIFDVPPVLINLSVTVVMLATTSPLSALFTLVWSVAFTRLVSAGTSLRPVPQSLSAARSEATGEWWTP